MTRNAVMGSSHVLSVVSLASSPASLADWARRDTSVIALGAVVRRVTAGAGRPPLCAAAVGGSVDAGLRGSHVGTSVRFGLPRTANFCRNAKGAYAHWEH